MEWILILVLIAALIYLFWLYAQLKGEVEQRARRVFEEWRARELPTQAEQAAKLLFQEWAAREEARIRDDAIRKSEAVIKGKITEHLIPYFPKFDYDPKDARFIGTPVDLMVFDGLSEGAMREVVFLEVKTGKGADLSTRERQVRNCVDAKKVAYRVIRVELGDHTGETGEK